jgi:hypothetical protein
MPRVSSNVKYLSEEVAIFERRNQRLPWEESRRGFEGQPKTQRKERISDCIST